MSFKIIVGYSKSRWSNFKIKKKKKLKKYHYFLQYKPKTYNLMISVFFPHCLYLNYNLQETFIHYHGLIYTDKSIPPSRRQFQDQNIILLLSCHLKFILT